VFAEVAEHRFGLTPLGACLQTGAPGSMRAWAILCGEELGGHVWGEILHSVRTGQPAFEHVFGMTGFQYFAQHPAAGALFNAMMTELTLQVATAVVAAYDFSPFGTLVDVGGGHGILIAAILRAHPQLRGVLFDLPQVVEGAQPSLESAGLVERCAVMGGNFFQAVPSGGDVYIL